MVEFPTFKGSWPWPWIGSYCIPSCVTHRPLPTHQISLKSKKPFVDGRTYRRTYGRTDIWDPPMLLKVGKLRGVDLKMETRHPVEGSFGSEFPAIYSHCGVMAAGSCKTLKVSCQYKISINRSVTASICTEMQFTPNLSISKMNVVIYKAGYDTVNCLVQQISC